MQDALWTGLIGFNGERSKSQSLSPRVFLAPLPLLCQSCTNKVSVCEGQATGTRPPSFPGGDSRSPSGEKVGRDHTGTWEPTRGRLACAQSSWHSPGMGVLTTKRSSNLGAGVGQGLSFLSCTREKRCLCGGRHREEREPGTVNYPWLG